MQRGKLPLPACTRWLLQEAFVRLRSAAVAFILMGAAVALAFPLTASSLAVTDDTGARVLVPEPPQRIISLTLASDEMLFSLVDVSRLLGITTLAGDPAVSNVADQADRVPNHLELNVETILSLAPDLVIASTWSDPAPIAQLRRAGVPVYCLASGTTIAGIQEKILRLALLVGETERGRQIVAQMDRRLREVDRRVGSLAPAQRLRVIDYGTWGGAMGQGSSWDEMLRRAGLVNAVGMLSADEWGQVPLSREKLLELDPDMIVLPGWVYGNPSGARAFFDRITKDPALRGLRAVRDGRVFLMPENLKSTTSQYVVDAVEWLARTAYPRRFP
jgi:iron complex transport system substrate-binding protein